MKIWLIVFLITSNGDFVGKKETAFKTYDECMIESAKAQLKMVNSGIGVTTFCVTNDHYTGKKADKGVPMDF